MNKIANHMDAISSEFSKMIKESPTDMIFYRLKFETADGKWYERLIRSDVFPEDDKLFKQTVQYIVRESIASFVLQTGLKAQQTRQPIKFDTSYDVFSFNGTLRVVWSTYYPEVTDSNE